MGWSCNKLAGLTLDAIKDFCYAQSGISNVFASNGNRYMIEISRREHRDGAITGTIYKYLENDRVKKSGSLRIEGDGKVSSGPAVLKHLPVYVLGIKEDRATFETHWESKRGEPTQDNLMKAVQESIDSYKEGGCNAHIARAIGHIPYPIEAWIKKLNTGERVCEWKAGAFQVYS